VFWGYLWFGLTDLLVVVQQDESFRDHYLMESGWGLLFLVLVAGGFAVETARPGDSVAGAQLVVCTAAVLLGGLWPLAVPQLLVAVGLLGCTVLALRLGRWQPPRLGRPRPVAAVLVVLALVESVVYGAGLAGQHALHERPTNGVAHLGVQVSLGLAVAGLGALAACTDGRLPALTAGVAAGWLGLESVAYPELVGSLGSVLGWAAAAWGVLLVAVTEVSRRRGGGGL
jgi:hypothetical protein